MLRIMSDIDDGNSRSEWFRDASFWERFAPVLFDENRWAEVPSVADGLARLSGVRPRREDDGKKARVLDLCCGTGRIAVELAVRGYSVTGVDITASYLEAARESARAAGVKLELVREDVRRYGSTVPFDLAVNLYISFGYFAARADDLAFARAARACLADGGRFVVEALGKEVAIRDFTEGEWFERGGGLVLTEYEAVDSWASIRNRWIFIKDGERFERSFDQRLYSAVELRALLLEAGFSSVACFGDWDGSPYDRKARVLIAVAVN